MNGDVGLLEPDDHGMGTQHVNDVKELKNVSEVPEFLKLLQEGWLLHSVPHYYDDYQFIMVRV